MLYGALACALLAPAPARAGGDAVLESGPAAALTLALGGDVMFGRVVEGDFRAHEEGPPEELAAGPLGRADLAIVNLETALCDPAAARRAARRAGGAPRLAAPPDRAAWLAAAGVDVAVVANNHALDCGPGSLERTRAHLAAAGVAAAGIRPRERRAPGPAPVVVRAGEGAEVAVLAATVHPPAAAAGAGARPETLWGRELGPLVAAVRAARAAGPDRVIVVAPQWGAELAPRPSAWQRAAARRLIEAGADVVHGHGPHSVQEIERHRGGVIAYSLGNLHFDMTRAGARPRALAWVELRRRGGRLRVAEAALVPAAPARDRSPIPAE